MFAEELVKIYNFHTFDGIGGSGAISGKKNPRVSKLNLIFKLFIWYFKDSNIERNNSKLLYILLAAANGDQLALETAHLSGIFG